MITFVKIQWHKIRNVPLQLFIIFSHDNMKNHSQKLDTLVKLKKAGKSIKYLVKGGR